jgi:MoxR-like ATPase
MSYEDTKKGSDMRSSTTESNPGYKLTEELTITRNPENFVLSSFQDRYRGLRICSDAPVHLVPTDKTLISTELSGSVSTKEELCRTLRSDKTCSMLIGDAGTGKNTAIEAIYNKIRQPIYRTQCNSGITKQDLIAQTELVDGNTVTTLKSAGLAAIFGGCLVLDEINLANNRVTAVINSMAEEKGKRRLEIPSVGATLTELDDDKSWNKTKHLGRYIHPEFRVIATRNPSTYTGTKKINDSLNDRFSHIRFEYIGIEAESAIIADELNVKTREVKPLVRTVQEELREARKHNSGTTCPISYRRVIDAVEYSKAHETSLYHAAIENIITYAQNEADREFMRSAFEDRKNELSEIVGFHSNQNDVECNEGQSGMSDRVERYETIEQYLRSYAERHNRKYKDVREEYLENQENQEN